MLPGPFLTRDTCDKVFSDVQLHFERSSAQPAARLRVQPRSHVFYFRRIHEVKKAKRFVSEKRKNGGKRFVRLVTVLIGYTKNGRQEETDPVDVILEYTGTNDHRPSLSVQGLSLKRNSHF